MKCDLFVKGSQDKEDFIKLGSRKKYAFFCGVCNIKSYSREDTFNIGTGLCKNCSRSKKKTHGMSQTRLNSIWWGMKRRCYNKNYIRYKDYGEIGIKVCKEWKEDFEEFAKWCFLNGYEENLTIDRKNNNGNYEPSNCRFITNLEQQNNKRELISTNTSGYKNICFGKKRKSWKVQIKRKGINVSKDFKDIKDAIIYKEKILKEFENGSKKFR